MRKITLIVIHCSAVKPDQQSSAADIDSWHKRQGWKCIGYHFVVRRDGSVERGRPVEMVGAHVKFHNRYSIGVCYEGGYDAAGKAADTRTPEQVKSLRVLVEQLHERFPNALIVGHHDLDPTKRKRPNLGAKFHQRPVALVSVEFLKQVVGLFVFNFL